MDDSARVLRQGAVRTGHILPVPVHPPELEVLGRGFLPAANRLVNEPLHQGETRRGGTLGPRDRKDHLSRRRRRPQAGLGAFHRLLQDGKEAPLAEDGIEPTTQMLVTLGAGPLRLLSEEEEAVKEPRIRLAGHIDVGDQGKQLLHRSRRARSVDQGDVTQAAMILRARILRRRRRP